VRRHRTEKTIQLNTVGVMLATPWSDGESEFGTLQAQGFMDLVDDFSSLG
jgi:hypothetical protein